MSYDSQQPMQRQARSDDNADVRRHRKDYSVGDQIPERFDYYGFCWLTEQQIKLVIADGREHECMTVSQRLCEVLDEYVKGLEKANPLGGDTGPKDAG